MGQHGMWPVVIGVIVVALVSSAVGTYAGACAFCRSVDL